MSSKQKTHLVMLRTNDWQIPFHDTESIKTVEHLMGELQPDFISYGGDIFDCPGFSDFTKEPKERFRFKEEVEMGQEIFKRHMKLVPTAKLDFEAGNHEYRINRYILNRADELYGLKGLSIPELFGLDTLSITYTPYDVGKIWYNVFKTIHGTEVRQHSGMTAKSHFQKYGMSGICGHSHRMGMYAHTYPDIGTFAFYENGCLCSLEPNWDRARPDWQQCVAVVHFMLPETSKEHARFHVEQLPIIHHKLVYGGKVYAP